MYPILIWYINKMATDRGGGVVDGVTATIACSYWSLVQIPTWIQMF
jgi:hypothetical protein